MPHGKQLDHRFHYSKRLIIAMLLSSTIIPGAQAGNFFKGRIIYATYCQACHGNGGKGSLSGTPNFSRGQALMKPDAQLFETVINGKNTMPGFQGVLKNEDIDDVISYIRSFY